MEMNKLIQETDTLRTEIDKLDEEIKSIKDREVKRTKEIDRIDKLKKYLNKFNEKSIQTWIQNDISQEGILFTEFFGRFSGLKDLSTSQIRNVFGEVRRIQMKTGENLDLLSLRMLQPKLSYAAARAKKEGTDELKKVLTTAIKTVLEVTDNKKEQEKRFENFANFFESILAYHKAYGGN